MMLGGGVIVTMIVLFVIFILMVAVVAVVYWLVRQNTGTSGREMQTRPRFSGEGPLDILRRRYASGEISKEEYEEMKQDLNRP